MPFIKIKQGQHSGKYLSPSGKVMTLKQVQAYYAQKKNKKSKSKKKRG